MVPVLDKKKTPLAPCSEKRARKLMERGDAKPYWKQGIFTIILQREPSGRKIPNCCIAIDPGSKRTGVTVTTEGKVIFNVLLNTPHWVKKHIELKRILRKSRRYRKTPYRKCRFNRKIGSIPPSTKARWQAHLRVVDVVKSIIPLTDVTIEDIAARTIKNARKWNKNFSPLEVGKQWFEEEINKRGLNFYTFKGYETKEHRDHRGFKKTSQKLKDVWEAHNVDSHCLAEMTWAFMEPFKGFYRFDFMQFHRRQLQVTNFKKGGIRKDYGGTLSLGIKRGTLVNHPKYGLSLIGGTSKGRLSLHSVVSRKRLCQNSNKEDCQILTNLKWSGGHSSHD